MYFTGLLTGFFLGVLLTVGIYQMDRKARRRRMVTLLEEIDKSLNNLTETMRKEAERNDD